MHIYFLRRPRRPQMLESNGGDLDAPPEDSRHAGPLESRGDSAMSGAFPNANGNHSVLDLNSPRIRSRGGAAMGHCQPSLLGGKSSSRNSHGNSWHAGESPGDGNHRYSPRVALLRLRAKMRWNCRALLVLCVLFLFTTGTTLQRYCYRSTSPKRPSRSPPAPSTAGWYDASDSAFNATLLTSMDRHSSECVAWRSPHGSQSCSKWVRNNDDGFCELHDHRQGRRVRVMRGTPGGKSQSRFRCEHDAIDFVNFKAGVNRLLRQENPPLPSRRRLGTSQRLADATRNGRFSATSREDGAAEDGEAIAEGGERGNAAASPAVDPDAPRKRGVVMSVHRGVAKIALTSLKALRRTGCTLPVEIWYRRDEMDPSDVHTRRLLAVAGVSMRLIADDSYRRFNTKVYAVVYSEFDEVLMLDADNIVARDPTYLFASAAFRKTGAIFWPDHWLPAHSPLFNSDESSLAWELFDVKITDMFEQESGQLLVDRRRARRALALLEYYVYNFAFIERLKVVWGDKDLFRFAWMRTGLPFHMIQTPPGLAGFYRFQLYFCGQTIVQHDADGEIVFFHRNTRKVGKFLLWGSRSTWRYVKQFAGDDAQRDYRTILRFPACWDIRGPTTLTDVRRTYAKLEADVLADARKVSNWWNM